MSNCIDRKILIKIKNVVFKYTDWNRYKFFLYWSRVDWDCREKSDYDVWIIWDKKLDYTTFSDIKDEFENIPALIDLVDFFTVSEDFKKQAMKNVIWLNK